MKNNDDTKNKLRTLEDRSRRDKLIFDGIEEWEEESWADTEQNLKDKLREILGIQNIKIERCHRVADKKRPPCRAIVAKSSSFKIKEFVFLQKQRRGNPKVFKFKIFRKLQ